MLAPIKSVKHYVQFTNATVASGAALNHGVAVTVSNTTLPTSTGNVLEGSILKAVYLEFWIKGNGASDADTQFNCALYKNPGGANVMDYADTLNMMAYNNKKNIFYAGQGVIGGVGGGQAVPVIRQWVKIPKGKQRFGLGDKLQFIFSFTGEAGQLCGLAVYKEYQ